MTLADETREIMGEDAGAEGRGDTPVFGFWLYLMSDCLLFASLFATYAVLHNNVFGGPGARELFDLPYVLAETLLLLTSSFTVGLGVLAARRGNRGTTVALFGLTLLLGLAFLGLELHEFGALIMAGSGPDRSGFLSAYFTLVGTHGFHVAVGVLWMLVMLVHVMRAGLTERNVERLTMLSLFWHFLDLIWVFIFTIVYLLPFL
ncbi:MAG TPA: cytochrome o ubiquinol oxidase subunit III [Candidatus Paceibacterota bacterium]|nr:cytochrome o ubiquinol oxidase subunit III [Candidatus Paceibacterota bacterium]